MLQRQAEEAAAGQRVEERRALAGGGQVRLEQQAVRAGSGLPGELVDVNDAVLIDESTTALALVDLLSTRAPLTVISTRWRC